jgi:hypothetical protein
MSMIDPPRAAVPDAVSKCRSAGIKGSILRNCISAENLSNCGQIFTQKQHI